MLPASKRFARDSVLSPNGRYLAIIEKHFWVNEKYAQDDPDSDRIALWDVVEERLLWRKPSPAYFSPNIRFSPDGSRLLCYGSYWKFQNTRAVEQKNHAYLWDTASGGNLLPLEIDGKDMAHDYIFSSDGKHVIGRVNYMRMLPGTNAIAGFISKVWDAQSGKHLRNIYDKPLFNASERWENSGARIFTRKWMWSREPHSNNKLYVWSYPDLEIIHAIETGSEVVTLKALSSDEKRVAFTYGRTTSSKADVSPHVQLWDTETKSLIPLDNNKEKNFSFKSLHFTPDGKTLVGCGTLPLGASKVARIYLWNAQTGALERSIELPPVATGTLSVTDGIQLLPDGKSFLWLTGNGNIDQRSLEDGVLIRNLELNE